MTNEITFIHLSDLHWNGASAKDQQIVANLLCEDIAKFRDNGITFDFLFFTGDLVQAGEIHNDFEAADEAVIAKVLAAAGLGRDRYMICPGNHDISRSVARSQVFLEEGLKSRLLSTGSVNKTVDQLIEDPSDPQGILLRLGEYEKYCQNFSAAPTVKAPLSSTFLIETGKIRCGITSFNNSWRATGESGDVDRLNLILGERNVDEALPHLEDCDLRIALFHHPLNWMAEFDSAAVKPRLYQNYDFILFGHVHELEPELRATITGTSLALQCGSAFGGRRHFNGYQIVTLNPNTGDVRVDLRTYFDAPARRWGAAENIAPNGSIKLSYKPKKKGVDPEIEKFIASARPLIRKKALDQFNIADLGARFQQDPHEAFVIPPLTITQDKRAKFFKTENVLISNEVKVELADLLQNEGKVAFSGPSGAGKTSLAHFCAVMIAEGITSEQKVPVIVDARTFNPSEYGVKRAIGDYLHNGLDHQRALRDGRLIFLLDNFDRLPEQKKIKIHNFANSFSKCGWLYFSTDTPNLVGSKEDDEEKGDVLHINIGYLPRKLIRTMTRRWCGTTGDNAQETFDAVMRQLESRDLPRTGYIVTLLLWGMDKSQKIERLNESHLLSAMSDFLLGKGDFASADEADLDSFTKEHILQEISAFLRQRDGSAEANDVLDFIIQLFREKALPYHAGDVLDGFVLCGILSSEGGQIKFKYVRFGEFYYAQRLQNNPSELTDLITTSKFLEFTREIELLSGLSRKNSHLIEAMINWLSVLPTPLDRFPLESFANAAENDRYLGADEKQLKDIQTKNLSDDEIDDLMDEAEREIQKLQDGKEIAGSSTDRLGKIININISRTTPPLPFGEALIAVMLLGKVLRNSEFSSKDEKNSAIKILIDYHVRISLVMLDIFTQVFDRFFADHAEKIGLNNENRKIIQSSIGQRVLIESFKLGTSGAASRKIVPLIREALAKNRSSLGGRLYLCLLWMDCGGEDWHQAWNELISDPTTPLLVQGLLADKLSDRVNQVPMTAAERRRVIDLSWEIVRAQGAPNAAKGLYIQKQMKNFDRAQRSLNVESERNDR